MFFISLNFQLRTEQPDGAKKSNFGLLQQGNLLLHWLNRKYYIFFTNYYELENN
jgi:hypothetical protein